MSYLLNNEQKINDIIFAHRNKNYGAYVIRSNYGNTLFKSLSVVISVCFAFASGIYLVSKQVETTDLIKPIIPPDIIHVITPVEIPHEETETKKSDASETKHQNQSSNQTNSKPVVIDSVSVETNSSTIEYIETSVTNSATAQGSITSGGDKDSGAVVSKRTPKESYEVDSEPEFEGGLKALYKFISQNVEYPESAIEKEKQGTVYVKFVVDEKGKVTDLSLRNSVGYGMDEEALRVVGIIPNFKTPAKAKGQAVKMYYQLSINFKMK